VTIQFYATIDADSCRPQWMPNDVAYLLPASSFARKNFKAPALPDGVEAAADCGGYVATRIWGDYRYSVADYVDWLSRWPVAPSWAATMDYCCEPDIAGNRDEIRSRQQRTTRNAIDTFERYGDAPWAWVPTLQGWDVSDYADHAAELGPTIREMQAHYYSRPGYGDDEPDETQPGDWQKFRVGIGTLCRRASVKQIRETVDAVSSILPGVPLHLWGVKSQTFKSVEELPPGVVSVDSAAWNGRFGGNIDIANAERAQLGMSQREYGYRVALPRYVAGFRAAMARPRQARLF
jgi:hypothetical protein